MGTDHLEAIDDALALAARTRRLSERAHRSPGLLDGHVARLRRDIERLVAESSKPTRGKHRELIRGANEVAAEIVALRRSGALAPKYVRPLDRALVKLRKRDFGRARDALRKLDRPLGVAREIEQGRAGYRNFYDRMDSGARQLEADIARLEAVPKPDRSPEECADAKRRLADLQQALDLAYSARIHGPPARDSLPELQELSHLPDAAILPPSDPAAAARLMELLGGPGSTRSALGDATVWQLREASEFSDAKFAYVVGGDPRGRSVLRENVAWLSALCAPGASPFRVRTLDSFHPDRLPALRSFLRHSPEGLRLLDDLVASMTSEGWASLLRSARLYDLHGELARKQWDGTLDEEIRQLRARRGALVRELKTLSRPDDLIPR